MLTNSSFCLYGSKRELCLSEGKIEGLDFFGNAVLVDDIGHANGHELDVLIGALIMERW
jgi:hypothetical protein